MDSTLYLPHEFQYFCFQQINEIIERYNSKSSRIEKLDQVQRDLKEQLNAQKAKKVKLETLLEKSAQKLQLLASNRQVYQEVEMKDAALSTARKEGDDCREREYRLRKSIEGLRRAVPRFLQKVNKDLVPDGGGPITVDQVRTSILCHLELICLCCSCRMLFTSLTMKLINLFVKLASACSRMPHPKICRA